MKKLFWEIDMKKIRKVYFLIILIVLILVGISIRCFNQDTRALELNGNKEMVIELNKPFEEDIISITNPIIKHGKTF